MPTIIMIWIEKKNEFISEKNILGDLQLVNIKKYIIHFKN